MLRKIKIFINNIAALIVFRVLKFIFPKKSNKGEGILFILLAPIGDQVISTIIFQNESFFTEKIYFLVERKYNGVWEDYLGKINIISLNSKLYKWLLPYRIIWIYRIRNLKIQKTINLNDNKSTVTDELSIFSGANEIIALSYESEKLQKFHKKFINKYYDMILFNNDVNQFEKLFGLLKKLGLQNPIRETRFYLNWNTFDKVEELLKKSGTQKNDRFITIAPFASKRFRSWPLQNFKKLIVQIIESANYKILLLGDNQFADEIDEISRININSDRKSVV